MKKFNNNLENSKCLGYSNKYNNMIIYFEFVYVYGILKRIMDFTRTLFKKNIF